MFELSRRPEDALTELGMLADRERETRAAHDQALEDRDAAVEQAMTLVEELKTPELTVSRIAVRMKQSRANLYRQAAGRILRRAQDAASEAELPVT